MSTNGMVRPCSCPASIEMLARGAKDKEHTMSQKLNTATAVAGIDIGKNSFHVVGLDKRGAIALRQKWSRGQVEARLANMPPCLIGMEACVGAHHLSRKLKSSRSRCPADAGEIRASLFEGTEERFPRCGSNRRGGATPDDEISLPQRPSISSTCRPCTGCVSGWSVSAPALSIRYVPSCWIAALQSARGFTSCARIAQHSRQPHGRPIATHAAHHRGTG